MKRSLGEIDGSGRTYFSQHRSWLVLARFGILFICLIPLALYAWVGFYTRYAADDYETAGSLQKFGLWGSQFYWRDRWSGRYAYFFVVSLFQMIGVKAAPALTLVFLCLWLAGLSWLLVQFKGFRDQPNAGYLSVLGSAVLLLVTLRSMGHIHQILFWVTGIFTYVLDLILWLFGLAYLVYRWHLQIHWRQRWWESIFWGGYAFLAAGLSELGMVLQLELLFLGLVAFYLNRSDTRSKDGLVVCSSALLFTLVGLGIMVSAPGNAARALSEPPRPDLTDVFFRANIDLIMFVANWIWRNTILAGIAFLTPLLIGLTFRQQPGNPVLDQAEDKQLFWVLLGSIPVLYLLLLSQFGVSFYTLSTQPPDRALVLSQFLLVVFCALWGFLTGIMLRQVIPASRPWPGGLIVVGIVLMTLLLTLGPVYASTRIVTMVEPARARALEWDERDRLIRKEAAERQRDIVVWYIQDFNRLGDYSTDPGASLNRAVADYYSIDSIIALDERP